MKFKGKKLILGKLGLDAHDNGLRIIAKWLVGAGYEVIYAGLYNNPQRIVQMAIEENADAIGLSFLGCGHLFYAYKLSEELKTKDFEGLDELSSRRDELINLANDIFRSRIKILKKTHKGVKVSVTYMEMLVETKNLLLHVVQLVKADFNLLESYTSANGILEEEILD